MTETRFKKLLWLYLALIGAASAAMFFPGYTQALALAYEDEPKTWLMANLWIAAGLVGGLLLVWLLGLVGLFRFKKWARPVSLCATLAALFISPFLGPQLSSGLESALFEASGVLWGAILALSYFSAISERFDLKC